MLLVVLDVHVYVPHQGELQRCRASLFELCLVSLFELCLVSSEGQSMLLVLGWVLVLVCALFNIPSSHAVVLVDVRVVRTSLLDTRYVRKSFSSSLYERIFLKRCDERYARTLQLDPHSIRNRPFLSRCRVLFCMICWCVILLHQKNILCTIAVCFVSHVASPYGGRCRIQSAISRLVCLP